jgi:3-dehydroquinate synthase
MKLEQEIQVTFRYAICLTRDVFAPGNDVLRSQIQGSRPKVAVFLDSGLEEAQPQLRLQIEQWLHDRQGSIRTCPPVMVQGGEACKNDPEYVLQIARILRDRHLDRHSYVVIVGGGAVLDAVGFAASITHRGIRHIRLPTTVLAQCDSGIGVKNGINFLGAKNFLGTFTPPWAVINDLSFLLTLSLRDWIAGISEAFKVAIIKDRRFLSFLIEHCGALRARDERAMEETITRCARLHADHIATGGDPFEVGSARPLDFGHWSAHLLETQSGYELRHGEAVAIGIALDLGIARNRGLISPQDHTAVVSALRMTGLPVWHPALGRREKDGTMSIYRGLEEFREHLGGELTLVMPKELGHSCEVHDLSYGEIERAVQEMEEAFGRGKHEAGKRQSSYVLS